MFYIVYTTFFTHKILLVSQVTIYFKEYSFKILSATCTYVAEVRTKQNLIFISQ